MGYDERRYMQPEQSPGRLAGTPVVKWLLVANVVVFVLGALGRHINEALFDWGAFTLADGIYGLQVWRLLSFQFLHANFFHLLFNMYALYVFGPFVENWWTSRKFAAYYLLSGAAGALFYYLLASLGVLDTTLQTQLVGASAGIFAVLIGTAILAPDMRIMLLFPPIPMKMRTFALLFIGIAAYMVITGGNNAGGEAGHLGGVLAGALFMKFPGLLGWLGVGGRVRRVGRRGRGVFGEPKLRPRSPYVPGRETRVDAILDKINREGFGSLTDEEREILRRAADEGQM